MKKQFIENIGTNTWGYAYKGYYIVPVYKRNSYTAVEYYKFYNGNFEHINLLGLYRHYKTLSHAMQFVSWRIEDAIQSYEQQEKDYILNRFNKEQA